MNQLIEFLKLRKSLYMMLSYPFYMEVDKPYLSDMGKYLSIFRYDTELDKYLELKEGASLLEDFFAGGIDDSVVEELSCAFARLFLVSNSGYGVSSVSPYESVYRSPEKLLMQAERDEVVKFYAEEGMATDRENFHEPEDHIGAELYFMAQMCGKNMEFANADNEEEATQSLKRQQEFLTNHISIWIDDLCNDMYKISDNKFYKGISRLTQGFIKWDKDNINSILTELNK